LTTRSGRDDVCYPRDFWLVLGAGFLFFFCFHLLLTPLPLYIQEMGGSEAEIGLVMGVFALASIAVRPLAGSVVDRWGRRPSLLIGASIFAVAPLMSLISYSVWAILTVRVFHGLGMAFFTTGYSALVTDLAPPSRRGEGLGLAGMASVTPLMIAPALSMLLLRGMGFQAVFALSGAFGVLSVVVVSLVRQRFKSQRRSSDIGWSKVVGRRVVIMPSLIVAVVAMGFGSVITFLPLFAVERGIPGMAYFFAFFGIANLISQPWAGWLSDRLGRRRVVLPGLLLTSVSLYALGLSNSSPVLLGVALAFGVSMGLTRPTLDAIIADGTPPEARGVAMGFDYACFDLGIGLGSFGLGMVAAAWGYGGMYSGVALLTLVAALMLVLIPSQEVSAS